MTDQKEYFTEGQLKDENGDFYIHFKESTDYEEYFGLFDSDSDGYISGEEIKRLFQAVGCNLTDKELNNIMKMGDKDENSSLDLNEFLDLMKSSNLPCSPIEREKELKAAFKKFDTNGDGFIDHEEFRKIMNFGGETVEEIDKLMDEYDINKDGRLDYKDWKPGNWYYDKQ